MFVDATYIRAGVRDLVVSRAVVIATTFAELRARRQAYRLAQLDLEVDQLTDRQADWEYRGIGHANAWLAASMQHAAETPQYFYRPPRSKRSAASEVQPGQSAGGETAATAEPLPRPVLWRWIWPCWKGTPQRPAPR